MNDMFNWSETITVGKETLTKIIDKCVEERMKKIKVRIPSEQINNSVVKFFTEKKWFLTKDGKKLDTYDLIRKFAMNTIGVAENGEINPEFLKIVREETAKIIIDQAMKQENTVSANPEKTLKNEDTSCDEPEATEQMISNFTEEDLENEYCEGFQSAVSDINKLLKTHNYGCRFNINEDMQIELVELGERKMHECKCGDDCDCDKSFEKKAEEFFQQLTPEQQKLINSLKTLIEDLNTVK